MTDEHYGDVTFCVVGMIEDLRARGLSRGDAVKVISEIDRRRRLHREGSSVVPRYAGDRRAAEVEGRREAP